MITAKDITGEAYHHTVGDVDTLHRLVEMLPPDPVVVNIGASFGTSTLAMLEARPDAFILSVDVRLCPDEQKHLEMAGADRSRVVRLLCRSQDLGKHWPAHFKVDMVFVDGAHDYNGVVADGTLWQRAIKPGGIIAFHDYGTPSLPSVARAVDHLFGDQEPLLFVERIKAYEVHGHTQATKQ